MLAGIPLLMLALVLLAPLSGNAVAEDLLGLYVGGAVGESRVAVNSEGFALSNFRENHSAFQLMAGVRPISLVGAEIDYIDFGHPSGSLNAAPASATLKGAAAFGVLYLPIPVIDVYGKAGLARRKLAFPECDQDEDYRDDGQTHVSQGGVRLRQQVVGLGFRRHDTGECG
jgi:hypothetical protein